MFHRTLLVFVLTVIPCCGAAVAQPAVVASDDEKFTGDQGLERQKTIVWLEKLLKDVVTEAAVEAIPGRGNSIILKGRVESSEDLEKVLTLARSQRGAFHGEIVNALTIAKSPPLVDVQVDVAMYCLSRSALRNAGSDLLNRWTALDSPNSNGEEGNGANLTTNFFVSSGKEPEKFLRLLTELEEKGIVKLLAKPRLTTRNGRAATYFSGGEQAVPSGGKKRRSVTFIPYGTRLTVLPNVLENGHVFLEAEPEISHLDTANGSTVSGEFVAGRVTQRVHTSMELKDGETAVLGGMIQHQVNGTEDKVWLLGDLPYIGPLFTTKTFSEEESELVVVIKATIVDPTHCVTPPGH